LIQNLSLHWHLSLLLSRIWINLSVLGYVCTLYRPLAALTHKYLPQEPSTGEKAPRVIVRRHWVFPRNNVGRSHVRPSDDMDELSIDIC